MKQLQPYIKDFGFYKTRFAQKQKELKEKLRDFALLVENFEEKNEGE